MSKKKFTITGTDGYESPTKCCKMVVFGEDVSDGTYTMNELIEENKRLKEELNKNGPGSQSS